MTIELEIGERDYWDMYWKKTKLPSTVTNQYPVQLLTKTFKRVLSPSKNKTFMDIGCGVGRWMVYFNRNFGFKVFGLDILGCKLARKNLKMLGVDGKIICKDLFTMKLRKKFDVVFSYGTVEHFTDTSLALKKHCELLKKDGVMIVIIPNPSGISGILLKHFDKEDLKSRRIITKGELRECFDNIKLKTIEISYIGSLNLGVIKWKGRFLRSLAGITCMVIWKFLRFESKYFSTYIIGVAKK